MSGEPNPFRDPDFLARQIGHHPPAQPTGPQPGGDPSIAMKNMSLHDDLDSDDDDDDDDYEGPPPNRNSYAAPPGPPPQGGFRAPPTGFSTEYAAPRGPPPTGGSAGYGAPPGPPGGAYNAPPGPPSGAYNAPPGPPAGAYNAPSGAPGAYTAPASYVPPSGPNARPMSPASATSSSTLPSYHPGGFAVNMGGDEKGYPSEKQYAYEQQPPQQQPAAPQAQGAASRLPPGATASIRNNPTQPRGYMPANAIAQQSPFLDTARDPLNPPPNAFSRPPRPEATMASFSPMVHKAYSDVLAEGFPKSPPRAAPGAPMHPFATHDVPEEEWMRLLEDIAIVGQRNALPGALVDAWNQYYFGPRLMELIVTRDYPQAGSMLRNNTPSGGIIGPGESLGGPGGGRYGENAMDDQRRRLGQPRSNPSLGQTALNWSGLGFMAGGGGSRAKSRDRHGGGGGWGGGGGGGGYGGYGDRRGDRDQRRANKHAERDEKRAWKRAERDDKRAAKNEKRAEEKRIKQAVNSGEAPIDVRWRIVLMYKGPPTPGPAGAAPAGPTRTGSGSTPGGGRLPAHIYG